MKNKGKIFSLLRGINLPLGAEHQGVPSQLRRRALLRPWNRDNWHQKTASNELFHRFSLIHLPSDPNGISAETKVISRYIETALSKIADISQNAFFYFRIGKVCPGGARSTHQNRALAFANGIARQGKNV
ncbi:hypothetical protein [Parvibaculum sp.]|uniref:hypothetical protein n=1 Tax=Parvibaculum sp. TaxID=2024848 RepID=UPI00273635A7|nr:hypothetical protein [Parvibaculum sp.]MDP3328955.1 hypothetical protein [Parvibaculum sp.]